MANVGYSTWYPDSGGNWSTNAGYITVTSAAHTSAHTHIAYPPKKGDPDPLEWLKRRVDEICEASGIAA